MKLKSIPSLGTRTIHLPVVGDVAVVDGVFEVSDDKIKEFLAENCGLVFQSLEGHILNNPNTATPSAENNSFVQDEQKIEKYPKSNFDGMRVQDLKGVFESLNEVLTDEEKSSFNNMKKQEMIDFLYGVLNSDRVIIEQEEEQNEQ
jgi:hypothetical protein